MDRYSPRRLQVVVLLTGPLLLGLGLPSATPDRQLDTHEYLQFREGMRCFREHDFQGALECWLPLAETGVGQAQYNVGRMYAYAEGVPRNFTEAYAWFVLAARNDLLQARRAMDQLSAHMTSAQISRAYERADEIELMAEPPGS